MRVLKAIILLLCANVITLHSKHLDNITFRRIGVDDGLSHNTVLSLCQDTDGYMWFGTANGLNRYDGYTIRTYYSSSDDSWSLPDNCINCLFLDSKGRMWVGTSNGLAYYERETDSFRRVLEDDSRAVSYIVEYEDGSLLVVTSSGHYLYDVGTGSRLPDKTFGTNIIYAAYKFGNDVLVSMPGALMIWDGRDRLSEVFKTKRPGRVFLKISDKELWLGTEGEGLYRVDVESGKSTHYLHDESVGGLCSNFIRSLSYDSMHNLWVGTLNGLSVYDSQNDSFTTYRRDAYNPKSISHSSVKNIVLDNHGGMWLATYYGGVCYWHPQMSRFKVLQEHLGSGALNDNIINCIVEDRDGTLWIGTNKGGANHYDPVTGDMEHFSLHDADNLKDLESDDVKAILPDADGRHVYLGAHAGGFNVLDKHTGTIRNVGGKKDVYQIIDAGSGKLWVGTLGGLYVFDTSTSVLSPLLVGRQSTAIWCMMERSDGTLWIGGKNGLEVYARDSDGNGLLKLDQPSFSGIDRIQCLFEDPDMTVWIATVSGLYSYSISSGEFRRPGDFAGLPRKAVSGLEMDRYGNLWLGTDDGLYRYNPMDGSYRRYTLGDGLQSNQFNNYAHCLTRSGEMYFGGVGGITIFRPEALKDNLYSPQPRLSGLKVFNREVRPCDDSGLLARDISLTRSITLKHFQNNFTLQFSVLNYISDAQNVFSYTLDGLEREWHTTVNNEVTYSNLPKGKYVFRLKAANNDGIWNPEPVSLSIRVKPIWFKSTVAVISFILLIASFVLLILGMILRQKDLSNKLEMERQEKEYKDKLNQFKVLAFLNTPAPKAGTAGARGHVLNSVAPDDEALISRALDIVNANLSNSSFSVDDFASAMNMSRSNLHLRIKEITGESALDFIHKRRFMEACHLLRSSNLSISEIGYKTGFKSPSYFAASFRKYVGCSPKEYAEGGSVNEFNKF